MGIQIGNSPYIERVQKGFEDSFMRNAVVASQERLKNAESKQKRSWQLGRMARTR